MQGKDCSSGASDCHSKGGCGKTALMGALVGGIVMFIYFSASWMLLPWHKNTMMSFKNAETVSFVLKNTTEKSGIYVLPDAKNTTVEGPSAFIAYYKNGISHDKMSRMLFRQFFLCLIGAGLLTVLLKKTMGGGGCPVFFSMTVGMLIAFFDHVPNLIWFHFPLGYSLVGMADDLFALTLAGMFISRLVLKTGGCTMGKDADKKCH